jgi:hypothetical protein
MVKKESGVKRAPVQKEGSMELIDLRNTDVILPVNVNAEGVSTGGVLRKICVWNKKQRGVLDASFLSIWYPDKGYKLIIGYKNNNMWLGKAPLKAASSEPVQL